MRVLQPRQDGALARDAFGQSMIDPLGTRQLERRGALHHAIGALCDPHRPHAAFGQQPLKLPRTDPIPRLLAPHRRQRSSGEFNHRLKRLAGALKSCGAGIGQQLRQQRLQVA